MKHLLFIFFYIISVCSGFSQDSYLLSNDSKLSIEGTSTVHNWTVTANTLTGSLTTDENSLKKIDFKVVVADIKSERGATMDNKMYAALQMETHPQILFSLKEVKKEAVIVGTLSIAGESKEVEIPSKIDSLEDKVNITGEYGIALKDYGIEPPTAMFGQVIVGPDVTVKFNLIFTEK